MTGKESQAVEEPETLFRVRPTKQARRENIFQTDKEKLWVISQLKLLRHWPLDQKQQERLESDLDFSKVHHRNETFYELRLDDDHLHQKNLRVFFWVQDEKKTIWIMHGYWKKSNRLEESVKTNVARRIKNLKGGIQDGSIK
jgi:hypothetical protein